MSYFYAARTVAEDRDLSRAASERYLMLQAITPRDRGARGIGAKIRWGRHRRVAQGR